MQNEIWYSDKDKLMLSLVRDMTMIQHFYTYQVQELYLQKMRHYHIT